MAKEESKLSPEVLDCFERAKLALNRENYDYAIELFARIVSLKMDFASARYLLRKAEQRRFKKNPPSPLKSMFNKLLCSILFLRALYQKRRNRTEAIDTYEACLRFDPFNITISNRLASLLLNEGMKESAIKVLEASLPFKRNNTFALKKLADLYYEKKDFRRARVFLGEILTHLPEDQEVRKRLKDLEASETIRKITA